MQTPRLQHGHYLNMKNQRLTRMQTPRLQHGHYLNMKKQRLTRTMDRALMLCLRKKNLLLLR
jgi:hypothetical protein